MMYTQRRLHDFLPDLKDLYTIDDLGNVYSDNVGIMKTRNRAGTDYQIINFMKKDGTKKTYRLHCLVMMAFNPIPNPEMMEVNHIDGNKRNNKLSNLEWVNSSENQIHAYRTGLQKSQKGLSKPIKYALTKEQVYEIHKLRDKGLSYQKIGQIVGATPSNVAKIIQGKTWSSVKFNDYCGSK